MGHLVEVFLLVTTTLWDLKRVYLVLIKFLMGFLDDGMYVLSVYDRHAGWTPQAFTSSRKNRAEIKQQNILNFLDDDEKAVCSVLLCSICRTYFDILIKRSFWNS